MQINQSLIQSAGKLPSLKSTLVASTTMLISLPLLGGIAFAQDVKPSTSAADRILIDFNAKNLVVYGIHSPKTNGKKNGVDAEFVARREGKQIATTTLDTLCKGSDSEESWVSRLKPNSDWNPNNMTSQGSEIFKEGILLIRLTVPLSQIFSKYPPVKVNPITNDESKAFVFKVPAVPLKMLKCGLVSLRFSKSRVLMVAPGYVSQLPENSTIISLALVNEELAPANANDAANLKKSQFGTVRENTDEQNSSPMFMPIVTGKQE